MTRLFTLAVAFALAATAAQAQQPKPQTSKLDTPGGLLSAGTPGVQPGTTGTTYGIPGAEAAPSMPGGSIPMGASTQQDNPQPTGQIEYNNSSTGLPGLPTGR